jgi:hypothetical protein
LCRNCMPEVAVTSVRLKASDGGRDVCAKSNSEQADVAMPAPQI